MERLSCSYLKTAWQSSTCRKYTDCNSNSIFDCFGASIALFGHAWFRDFVIGGVFCSRPNFATRVAEMRSPVQYVRAETLFYLFRQERKRSIELKQPFEKRLAALEKHPAPSLKCQNNVVAIASVQTDSNRAIGVATLTADYETKEIKIAETVAVEVQDECALFRSCELQAAETEIEIELASPPVESSLVKSLIDSQSEISSKAGLGDMAETQLRKDDGIHKSPRARPQKKRAKMIEVGTDSCMALHTVKKVVGENNPGDVKSETLDSISEEFVKFPGDKVNKLPRKWHSMENDERRDVIKSVRDALDRLGLRGVESEYRKDKHFVKYAGVLDVIRSNRPCICVCGAATERWRMEPPYEHSKCGNIFVR